MLDGVFEGERKSLFFAREGLVTNLICHAPTVHRLALFYAAALTGQLGLNTEPLNRGDSHFISPESKGLHLV
jgi:hypothetical protein